MGTLDNQIAQALMGNVDQAYKDNVLYTGGQALQGLKISPSGASSKDFFLANALAGLGSGVLRSAGEQMVESQYAPQFTSLFESLSPEGQPNPYLEKIAAGDWSPKDAATPLLLALQQQSRTQELADKKELMAEEIAKMVQQQNIMLGNQKSLAEAKRNLATTGTLDGTPGATPNLFQNKFIGQKAKDEFAASDAAIKEMRQSANELTPLIGQGGALDKANNSIVDWALWQAKSKFATTEEGKIQSRIDLLIRNLTKAVEGARPSDYDSKTYARILGGDWTVSPLDVQKLVGQAETIMRQKQRNTVLAYEKMWTQGQAGFTGEGDLPAALGGQTVTTPGVQITTQTSAPKVLNDMVTVRQNGVEYQVPRSQLGGR